MELGKYRRIPFEVEAVQVTEENLYEIARWTEGSVYQGISPVTYKMAYYVSFHGLSHNRHSQIKAFPGGWIVFNGVEFKLYSDRLFKQHFEKDSK